MTRPLARLVDEAYARINCYGIGSWLEELYTTLNLPFPPIPPTWEPQSSPRSAGLIMTINRNASIRPPLPASHDMLVLTMMEGDASAPAPRGLDPARETPRSAMAKLSTAFEGGSPERVAAGDTRISYFTPDGKVVELRFNPNLVGFDRVVVAALGTPSAYAP